jgi:hypothetical protein
MTTNYTYHRTIRKLVVAFGDLFNEIKLSRYNSAGNEVEKFLVPIVYGGKEKYVSRLEGDPNLDKKVQVSLPIMSFEMTNMSYDAERKLNTNIKNVKNTENGAYSVYNPVPFDFDFTLYAYVRNIEDGAQLMEKILPYFTPDYTISVNLIPELGIVKQLPIVLKGVENEIDYEGDYNTNVRSVIWTLRFTVKGYLYGPATSPKLIRTAITNIYQDGTSHENDIEATLTSGSGNFIVGEEVYQGYSYSTATALGTVKDWSSVTNKLLITNPHGHFTSSSNVYGQSTNSTWNVSSFAFTPRVLTTITVTPDPSDVVLPNTYTYNVSVTSSS